MSTSMFTVDKHGRLRHALLPGDDVLSATMAQVIATIEQTETLRMILGTLEDLRSIEQRIDINSGVATNRANPGFP